MHFHNQGDAISLNNNSITGSARGVLVDGGSAAWTITGNTVGGGQAGQGPRGGFEFVGLSAQSTLTCTDNTLSHVGGGALHFENSEAIATVANNQISDSWSGEGGSHGTHLGIGLSVQTSTRLTVRGNTFRNHPFAAVVIDLDERVAQLTLTDNDQAGSGRDVVLQNVPQAAEVTIERSGEVVTLTGEDQVNIRRRSGGISNYTLIAAGSRHLCALFEDQTAHCMGRNPNGQLGEDPGQTPQRDSVTGLTQSVALAGYRFVELAAGDQHTCGLNDQGEVYCWGDNSAGQLGEPGANSSSPRRVNLGAGVQAQRITAASDYACAVLSSNRVMCWGQSEASAHGLPISEDPNNPGDLTRSPTLVTTFGGNDLSVRGLWSGPGASCGLYADQIVRCWGEQSIGLSDLPPERPQGAPGFADGRLTLNTFETDPTLNRRHITINELMICAIDDLDVKCWGRPSNEEGQPEFGNSDDGRTSYLVDGQDGPARVQLPQGQVPIALATRRVDLNDWGRRNGQPPGGYVPPRPPLTCAVMRSGQLWCWGISTHNLVSERLELATPVQVQNEAINDALDVQIAEGKICVLRRGGVVSCWGDDNFALDDMIAGQIGAFRAPEAVSFPEPIGPRPIIHSFAAGPDFAVVARGVDGGQAEVWRWQEGQPAQVVNQGGVQVLPNDAAIAVSGSGATCAATDQGVWCSGRLHPGIDYQEGGQIIQGIPGVVAQRLACGYNHCCAYSSESGEAYCWGGNHRGQAGREAAGGQNTLLRNPQNVRPGTPEGILNMALGRSHSCALTEDGGQPAGVYCWGDHEFGQLGVGGGLSATHMPQPALEQALPFTIAAGDDHTCALEQAGQGLPFMACWGRNALGVAGQPGGPATLTEPTPIRHAGLNVLPEPHQLAANDVLTCAIDGVDQRIACFGVNQAELIRPQGIPEITRLSMSDTLGCGTTPDEYDVLCWGINDDPQAPAGAIESYPPDP